MKISAEASAIRPSGEQPALRLQYDKPAEDWGTEGLPLGNGYLGATVFGGVESDKILLNEHTLWSGGPGAGEDYDGGHNEATAEENYENLAYAREELQNNMTEFTENSSSYIDENGEVISEDYPAMSDELTAAINALKGEKNGFGTYQELGELQITDLQSCNMVEAATNCNTDHDLQALFDGNVQTSWFSAGGNNWGENSEVPAEITMRYSMEKAVGSYTVVLADDTVTHGRNPEEMALYGSYNGNDWVKVDHRTNVGWSSDSESKTFELAMAVAYPYYKLSLIMNAGVDSCGNATHASVPAWGFSVSEISFDEPQGGMIGYSVSGVKDTNIANLFDEDTGTKWFSSNGAGGSNYTATQCPFDLVVKYALPHTISGYSLTNGEDSIEYQRDPSSWAFYGSNDGANWTLLDERADVAFGANLTKLSFSLESPAAFRQYKLTVREYVSISENGTQPKYGNGVQLSEFTLDAVQEYPLSHTNNDAESEAEKVSGLFDQDDSTKFYVLGGRKQSTVVSYPVWAQISAERVMNFASYSIVSGEDSPERDPKSWELQGSNDGFNWTVLDTQSDITFTARKESKTFKLAAPVDYRFVRWNVTAVQTDGKGLQASDLILLDGEGKAVSYANLNQVVKEKNYRRVLDLDHAIASVSYAVGDLEYEREYFASYPENVMAVKYTATDAVLNKRIALDTAQTAATVIYEGDTVTITGRPADHKEELDHLMFAGRIKILSDGDVAAGNAGIEVTNAKEITLYISTGTNYQQCSDATFDYFKEEDPLEDVKARIAAATQKGYDTLKQEHIADYTNLYDRVKLDLGGSASEKNTDELLAGYSNSSNTTAEDRYLETLFYQYGRYLMIASSRPGSLPANLQGIWASGIAPPWNSDYHTNINVQMNYWLAEQTNLPECHQPLIDYIRSLVARGTETARHYHYTVDENGEYQPARGWTTYHENNIWGNTAPGTSSAFYFPVGAAWLCQHLWEQYAFSGDQEQLAENFDVMLGAAIFWVDNLVVDERDGTLVSSPSYSPEHGPYSLGCTQDQAIIWELFHNTLQASEVLEIETDEIAEIRNAYEKLSGLHIGKAGQFQEWKDEVTIDITGDNGHRHVNHLYALHPGTQVIAGRSEEDDAYLAAIEETLNTRGNSGIGWSRSWKMALWARLRNGEHAFSLLQEQIINATCANLYVSCYDHRDVFQIDANFGATAGMTEMLLQSQGDAVELLPALPSAWNDGSVIGLRARGNIEVDTAWSDGMVTEATLHVGTANEALQVKAADIGYATVKNAEGQPVEVKVLGEDAIEFSAETGEQYTITFDRATILKGKAAAIDATYFTEASYDAFMAAVDAADDEDALAEAIDLLEQSEKYPAVGMLDALQENYYYSTIRKLAVADAEELADLADAVEAGKISADYIIYQTQDIDLARHPNLRIGENVTFAATYDGGGHRIINMVINDSADNTALFPKLSGTLKNFTIEGASVTADGWSAIVASRTYGTQSLIENVHVKNSTFNKVGTNNGIGIIVNQPDADTDNFTLKNCTVSGTTINANVENKTRYNVGFIAAKTRTPHCLIENCYSWGNSFENLGYKWTSVGGIIGESLNSTLRNCGVLGNTLNGSLGNWGGIAGISTTNGMRLENCYSDTVLCGYADEYNEGSGMETENCYEECAAADIESGKLAYTLKASGAWVQKNMPMIAEGKEPFAVTLLCKNEGIVLYTDEKGGLIGEVPEVFAWEQGERILSPRELKATVFTEDAVFTERNYMRGDLNGNGALDIADVILLLQHLVGYDVELKAPSDFSEDGRASIFDAVLLLKEVMGGSEALVATAKPSSLLNLWTPTNRDWGVHINGETEVTWYGSGIKNPGHTATEWIEVQKDDILCFGAAYYNMSHIVWLPEGSTTADFACETTANGFGTSFPGISYEKLSDTWYIVQWKAPSNGKLQILNKQNAGNNEFFLVTLNQPFGVQEYLDHFGNNSSLLNAIGYQLDSAGAEAENADYSTTTYIPVTPGETLTLGPVTRDQASFGFAYDDSKNAVKPITQADLQYVNGFDCTTGYYAHMGSGQAGPNLGFSYLVDDTAGFYSYTVPDGVRYLRVSFKKEATPKFTVARGIMDMEAYCAIEGVETDSVLAGKTALFVGDSITHGTQDTSEKEGINYRGWAGRIADAENMLVYNYGRSASSISDSPDHTGDGKSGTIRDQLDNSLVAGVDFDHVVIAGGINDLWADMPVGTATAADEKSGFDTATYAGALEATFAKAIEYYGSTAAISYILNFKVTSYAHAEVNNTAKAEEYNAVAQQICEKWGVNCIDLYTNETVLEEFEAFTSGTSTVIDGTADNLHPNTLGYDVLAPIIAEGMKQANPVRGVAYVPASLKEANLWTAENRNWGYRSDGGTYYWGDGRYDPAHNSSEWIDVEKGDKIYFAAAYVGKNPSHINWCPEGTELTASTLSNDNVLWLDTFANTNFRMGVWTAPSNGKVSLVNRQDQGNDDFYMLTKNRPFSMKEYLDYFSNHVWILESTETYIDGNGTVGSNENYFSSDYIAVTPGEVVTLGPVVTGSQAYIGALYNAAKKPIGSIAWNELTYKGSFDYETGYYSASALGNKTTTEEFVVDYQYRLEAGADVYAYRIPEGVSYIRVTFLTDAKTKAFVLRGDVGIEGYYSSMGVEAENPLIGKSALFIGDSITESSIDYAKEGVAYRGWGARIADKYDMLVDNYGMSSCALSTVRGENLMIIDELHAARNNHYDYVMLHGGVNDIWNNPVAEGIVDSDEFNYENFDQDTFAGGLEAVIATAVKYFGDTASIGYIWNFRIKDSNWATALDAGKAEDYYDTVVAICEKWNITLIDLYNNEDLNNSNFYDASTPNRASDVTKEQTVVYDGTGDNVHANALGFDILAPIIGAEMEKMPTTPYNSIQ